MQCLQALRSAAPAPTQQQHAGSSGSSNVRCAPPCLRSAQRRCSRRPSRLQAAVVDDGQATQQQQPGGNGVPPSPPAAAQVQASAPIVALPEEFQLPSGQLSHVERSKPLAAADAFRCAACTRPECQVRPGGAAAACGARSPPVQCIVAGRAFCSQPGAYCKVLQVTTAAEESQHLPFTIARLCLPADTIGVRGHAVAGSAGRLPAGDPHSQGV